MTDHLVPNYVKYSLRMAKKLLVGMGFKGGDNLGDQWAYTFVCFYNLRASQQFFNYVGMICCLSRLNQY